MSKYLKSGTPGIGYVQKNLTARDDLYVKIDLSFDGSLTQREFVEFLNGTTEVFAILWDSSNWNDPYDTNDFSATPVPQALGTFQTLELHYNKNIATEAWVDGILLWSDVENFNLQVDHVRVGSVGSFGSHGPIYTTNVRIGTSRGASDLFFDDFSSGDFSAWDSSFGAVAVVDSISEAVSDTDSEVSVAFVSSTLEPEPTWVTLDDPNGTRVVTAWRIDRGRSSEFDKTVTGTASIDFADPHGTLDPTNASGPHFGEIDPMKQVRVRLRNPNSGVWSYLFKGFASEWQYDVDISEKFTKVSLDASDAFDLLSALEMTPGHHGDTAPAESELDIFFDQGPPGVITGHGPSRINKALDDAGWPAGPREVFPGNVLIQQSVYARLDQLLSVIFDAADAEFPGVANVYISKSGYVTFHGRYTRFDPTNPAYGIQTWTVGDHSAASGDATVAPISGLSFRRSKSDLINVALCTPQIPGPGGEFTTAELSSMLVKDDTSIDTYGWRSSHFENLLTYAGRTSATATTFPTNARDEVTLFSEWLVHNYKDPKTRVEQIVFRSLDPDSFSGPAIWDLLCGVEIGDIVNLTTTHPGGGGFAGVDFFVEGIHYDAVPFHQERPDITLTLDVSPKSLYDFNPFA